MTRASSWLQGILLLGLVVLLGAFILKPAPLPAAKRKAVVVELFTSEGCSSCPPADELLSRMRQHPSANGAEIIPLGFHVDYWDHQGWRDRFSSHAYTERQEQYASRFRIEGPYTPQMVVDGTTEFVGNNSGRAQEAIARAASEPPQVEIEFEPLLDGTTVRIHGAKPDIKGEVMLAITEDNLVSKVQAGENDGHELHHSAAVRELRPLGKLANGNFTGTISGNQRTPPEWKRQDLHYAVFVQSPENGAILGAASLSAGK